MSSKGMYLRVWMLFTSVFTCICYRMYIYKINVTCHKHTWWVKEANGVYVNPKIYRILNALKFKYFEVLEKISDFEKFTQVKEFSKLPEIFRKGFYSFSIFSDWADFKEWFKSQWILFSGLG